MSNSQRTELSSAVSEPSSQQLPGVDYQLLFREVPLEDSLHDEPIPGHYDFTLDGLSDTDPESYRMVVYGWA